MFLSNVADAYRTVIKGDSQLFAPSYPNMTAQNDCHMIECERLPLPSQEDVEATLKWPDEGLFSGRWPAILFLIEGECDILFGIPEGGIEGFKNPPPQVGRYVVSMKSPQFVVLPAHIPREDGSRVHWQRADQEKAHSVLMWFIFIPTGCMIHFCKTHVTEHYASNSMYLPVPQAFRLALDLESELLSLRPKWRTAARSYLELILTTLEREATSARSDLGILLSGLTEGAVNSKTAKPNVGILKDACNFIEDRLHEPIQVSDITKFCDIPNVALNRLFRTFSKTTVSQYIIERRLERASDLLRDSNLTVKLIAEQSGFPHMEHFSRTFKKHRGLSPLAYRRRFQKPD